MHLPKETTYLQGLVPSQRFCVEFWHGQTFPASLDSYRVRLHNGRTILNELWHEIDLGVAEGADLQVIAQEAIELCSDDDALKHCLGTAADTVLAALKLVADEKSVKEANKGVRNLAPVKAMRFLLADTLPVVNRGYLREVFKLVRDHLQHDTHPFFKLRSTLSALLADLVDAGWTLESLHEWALNIGGKGQRGRSFEDRFSFMERLVTLPAQTFKVCLRLSGSPLLSQLGTFKGWSFAAQAPQINTPPREVRVYLRANPQTSFATYDVEAVDFKSASHKALEAFEECLDRLRFNLLDTKVRMDPRLLIIRSGDQKTRLERVAFPVPNPVFTVDLNQFRRSSERIDELLQANTLDATSRERIASAARHYRLGRDAESYRDKLLNWWFGLEYLTKVTNQGSIGGAVTTHARNCMSARYILLLLLDLQPSLRKTLGTWPASVTTLFACGDQDELTPEKLLRVMQNSTCRTDVHTALANRPWLQVRFQELAERLSDAEKLADFIKRHEQRVEWQLKRLYRVRCCLVHGSPLVLRLMLLCANLEFYLRECTVLILKVMLHHSQVASLNEFYDRLAITLERRRGALTNGSAGSPSNPTMIFDGIVTTTR